MKRLLVSFMLLLLSTSVFAQTVQATIQMDSIELAKKSEEYGDELYLVVTQFGSDGANTQYTIPHYPVTWPSEAIHQVKNVKVWQGQIAAGKEVEIIIELVEHDAPPYNVDDSIGSIRIKLSNIEGNINTSWDQNWHENATKNAAPEIVKPNTVVNKSFEFKGDGGHYTLVLSQKSDGVINQK